MYLLQILKYSNRLIFSFLEQSAKDPHDNTCHHILYEETFLYKNRITYETISELTFFMKVLHFSILNNILQHEINEKPC